jgi:hypothetical protein
MIFLWRVVYRYFQKMSFDESPFWETTTMVNIIGFNQKHLPEGPEESISSQPKHNVYDLHAHQK